MDYFKQRRAFRKLKRDQIDISTGQNNLYRELLDYANDEGVLDKLFTLKNSALIDLTGLSEAGLKKARNELVQLDLIEYVPGKRNKQKPKYRIIQFYDTSWATKTSKSSSTSTVTSSSTGSPESSSTGSSKVLTNTDSNLTITKHHDDEQQTGQNDSPIILWQKNYISINQIQLQKLEEWTNKLGNDLMCEAITRVATAGIERKGAFGYLAGIVNNWSNANVKSFADVAALDKAHENEVKAKQRDRSAGHQFYGRNQVKGVVPSWMKEAGDGTEKQPSEQAVSSEEIQAKLARVAKTRAEQEAKLNGSKYKY
ncbi:DnaD domain protein [Lapidilactobacillus gannanensis]|uniref:DnaD domain protein n=1 Tax=Lapidilactobacillus gannanensis TaxID=2486002 RepID=A0ABW4BKJ0_9LACO|nr:DnaD domain protein [Lapidilactobacillus gannanensis]